MAILSNQQIRQAINDRHIICQPLVLDHIGLASLDVTLGYYYFKVEQSNDQNVYNPFNREQIEGYFDGPYKAMPQEQYCKLNGLQALADIPPHHPIIVLKPGQRILAHSHEFIGIKTPGSGEIRGRSSWGRNGVAVCFDASWIDPGYINRLTLTIMNLNQSEAIILPVGERIAKIIFSETGPVEGSYNEKGKYQLGNDIDKIISTWTPEQLLPKSYLDKRQLPLKIEGSLYD